MSPNQHAIIYELGLLTAAHPELGLCKIITNALSPITDIRFVTDEELFHALVRYVSNPQKELPL
jgi:hypothetical protein